MPVFRYEVTRRGAKSRGYVTADTAAQGRKMLREKGLQILEFDPAEGVAGSSRSPAWPRLFTPSRRQAVDEFTHYLSMLLRVGVPLAEALNLLIRQVPKQIEPVLRRLSERVSSGTDLAGAMADEGGLFDSTYVGIVRVGQASGMLEECLEKLVRLRRRQHLLRQRLQSTMAYPTVVACVGVLVVIFLMTFVVPRITEILQQTHRALPLPTRVLLASSNAITGYWWLGLTLLVTAVVAMRSLDKQRRIRTWFSLFILKVHLLGSLLMKAGIAQITAMLETMLRSGLPLDESLAISRNVTGNPLLKAEFGRMLEALRSGHPMVDLGQANPVLPPAVLHVLSVGETTGQLEEMLTELSTFYDAEVEITSSRAVAMLEPIVIVIMSCIVGFIVMAILLPILRISSSL